MELGLPTRVGLGVGLVPAHEGRESLERRVPPFAVRRLVVAALQRESERRRATSRKGRRARNPATWLGPCAAAAAAARVRPLIARKHLHEDEEGRGVKPQVLAQLPSVAWVGPVGRWEDVAERHVA